MGIIYAFLDCKENLTTELRLTSLEDIDMLMSVTFMKLQKLELVLSWATLHFVGWVEPAPSFFGFRCTQPNLHFAGVIAKYETQQRSIFKPSLKSFFFDQTGRWRPAAALV